MVTMNMSAKSLSKLIFTASPVVTTRLRITIKPAKGNQP
jgi:hypothetical protein